MITQLAARCEVDAKEALVNGRLGGGLEMGGMRELLVCTAIEKLYEYSRIILAISFHWMT